MKRLGKTWAIARRVWTWGIISILFLGLFGQLVRDRAIWLAVLMYLPILPVGVVGLVQDLARRGRGMPRVRFGLAMLSVVAIGWSVWHMTGSGRGVTSAGDTSDTLDTVRLVQWNVMWGTRGKEGPWKSVVADIAKRKPDIAVLSEGPSEPFREMLLDELGGGWSVAVSKNSMRVPGYWYNMAVCSRWPVRRLDAREISSGRTMLAEVDAPGGAIRILMVDGASSPLWSRPQRLADVVWVMEEAKERGQSIDWVAGDFNTVSRSVGFERLLNVAEGGFSRASDRASWRGTWPAGCPLYDIDHVLVGRRWATVSCEMFSNSNLDHRGRVVVLKRRR